MHTLYVRYSPAVVRFVNSMVYDQREAEDITQSVFAKLMKTIQNYDQSEVPFDAWIMRVARSAALDHMRVHRPATTDYPAASDTTLEIGAEGARSLREALEELPEAQREILVLRHIAGLSPLEIANVLGRSESAVHGLHHRGRRTLQAKLVELGAEKRSQTSS